MSATCPLIPSFFKIGTRKSMTSRNQNCRRFGFTNHEAITTLNKPLKLLQFFMRNRAGGVFVHKIIRRGHRV